MVKADEDALICDFAETYHIFDYKRLPLPTAAVFACGLKEDSRVVRVMSDQFVSADTLLLARITDATNMLVWLNSQDAQSGKNRPNSIADALLGNVKPDSKNEISFDSGEEFEHTWQALTGGDG
jgi:hypothetical protein